MLSLPICIGNFTYVVVMMLFGIGAIITPLGLPVIAAAVAGARGWGRMERTRATTLLDARIPTSAARIPRGAGPAFSAGSRRR